MKWILITSYIYNPTFTIYVVFQYTEEANKNHHGHKEKAADCVDQGEEINLDNLDTTIRYVPQWMCCIALVVLIAELNLQKLAS